MVYDSEDFAHKEIGRRLEELLAEVDSSVGVVISREGYQWDVSISDDTLPESLGLADTLLGALKEATDDFDRKHAG